MFHPRILCDIRHLSHRNPQGQYHVMPRFHTLARTPKMHPLRDSNISLESAAQSTLSLTFDTPFQF
jgi:hypothetical protein